MIGYSRDLKHSWGILNILDILVGVTGKFLCSTQILGILDILAGLY